MERLFHSKYSKVLAWFRITFCLSVLFLTLSKSWVIGDTVKGVYTALPTLSFLGTSLLDLSILKFIYHSLLSFLLLSALGIFTRFSLFASAILYLLLYGTYYGTVRSQSSPYVWHSQNIIFFVLLILSVAKSHLEISVERFVLKKNVTPEKWPYQLLLFTLGIVYFGSAYCKLMISGWRWSHGEVLRAFLMESYLLHRHEPALILAQAPTWFLGVLGAAVLGLEATFILFVFVRRVRWLYIVGMLSMHVGIYYFMNINFLTSFCLVYLLFVPELVFKMQSFVRLCWKSVRSIESPRMNGRQSS